jgi:hypothetical protein
MNARMSVIYDFNGSNWESTQQFRSIPNARHSSIRWWYLFNSNLDFLHLVLRYILRGAAEACFRILNSSHIYIYIFFDKLHIYRLSNKLHYIHIYLCSSKMCKVRQVNYLGCQHPVHYPLQRCNNWNGPGVCRPHVQNVVWVQGFCPECQIESESDDDSD